MPVKRATSNSPVTHRRRAPRTPTAPPANDAPVLDLKTERVQNERVLSSIALKRMVRSHAAAYGVSIPMAWRDLAIAGQKYYKMEEASREQSNN